jgi:hypothetical protein
MEVNMDTTQAREHLQWVHGIVRVADRHLHLPPATLIAWGLFGAIVDAVHQARASGFTVPDDQTFQLPLLLLAAGVTVYGAWRGPAGHQTLVDSYAGTVFLVVFGVLLITNVFAQHTVVPTRAMSLFWNVGLTMAMLIVGLHASRPLLAGGVALLAASVAACLVPGWFDGLLAFGWVAGLVAPGVFLALDGSDGRAAAV